MVAEPEAKVFQREKIELEGSGAGEFRKPPSSAQRRFSAGRKKEKGPELFIVAGDLHGEIFPEIIGTGGRNRWGNRRRVPRGGARCMPRKNW